MVLFLDQKQILYRSHLVVLVRATALQPGPKILKLHRFKSDQDEIWQECP